MVKSKTTGELSNLKLSADFMSTLDYPSTLSERCGNNVSAGLVISYESDSYVKQSI